MKRGFYFRLAGTGIVKNRKLYFPYILTCICMVMMFYVVAFLGVSKDFARLPGADTLQMLMQFGAEVIGIFSVIFLYYSNSFLIRKREKEFGLYHILGMGKPNLVKILVWENLIIAAVSIVCGVFLGVLFSKLGELAAARIIGGDAGFGIEIRPDTMTVTAVLFLGIYFLVMLRMIVHIYRSRPVELLRSEHVGEKPPRANWILAVLGVLILAAAYYIAVSIEEPMTAFVLFFVAVIMVIVATYLLFIAGSVALCRLLQKNPGYYYKTKHFVSLSSMVYRMKRNGAGLASICILSTMMLVTVSSTVCLYAGTEKSLQERYPRDLTLNIYSSDSEDISGIEEIVEQAVKEENAEIKEKIAYQSLSFSVFQDKEHMYIGTEQIAEENMNAFSAVRSLYVVALEDYNAVMGKNETLQDGEALLYSPRRSYDYPVFSLEGFGTWNVKIIPSFVQEGMALANVSTSYILVVKDISVLKQIEAFQAEIYGEHSSLGYEYYGIDLNCGESVQKQIYEKVRAAIREKSEEEPELPKVIVESRAYEKSSYYGLTGGLFFLGILLGIVFLFGTVLIMYYKQISEGYEDQDRFEILMKVGMSRKEVKQSIRSQMLTIFLLPLMTAGIHLLFAFPLITKLMILLVNTEEKFLSGVTIVCYVIFSLFYVIVYMLTSREYGNIVLGKKAGE